MARVTVEDCIVHLPNRFELVIIAAQRAKAIASGTPLTIDRDNDKDAVVSLREIADRTISLDDTREEIIQGFCKKQMIERIERPVPKSSAEVQEMLAEEGEQVSDDVSEHLSIGMPSSKGSLSFESDNVEVED